VKIGTATFSRRAFAMHDNHETTTHDLTTLTINAVQEAGKIQGRVDVLVAMMDQFAENSTVCEWVEKQLISAREKSSEVYSMLRMVE
jgi:hypothetical protein